MRAEDFGEQANWIVRGKDPETGKEISTTFEHEEDAKNTAAAMSLATGKHFGVYSVRTGIIVHEYSNGKRAPDDVMRQATAAGSFVGSCLGVLIWLLIPTLLAVAVVLFLKYWR